MKERQYAVSKIIDKMAEKPDIIYGHFWHSAYAGFPTAYKHSIPLFVASGEAEIELHKYYKAAHLTSFINYISGVICVSSKNQRESVEASLTIAEKCAVIPNAIDHTVFYHKDKSKMREALGFKPDDFIVAFVGGFIHRKGAKRVAEAIQRLRDDSIKSIFIGRLLGRDDSELPNCNGILYRGALPHNLIPDYLNSADVFVLPTLHEGCCNAIVEALACGLPVISSNRDFNFDILDARCACLIDPMNINEISDAISRIRSDKVLQQQMSDSALKKAQSLDINMRAMRIMNFILGRMSD